MRIESDKEKSIAHSLKYFKTFSLITEIIQPFWHHQMNINSVFCRNYNIFSDFFTSFPLLQKMFVPSSFICIHYVAFCLLPMLGVEATQETFKMLHFSVSYISETDTFCCILFFAVQNCRFLTKIKVKGFNFKFFWELYLWH